MSVLEGLFLIVSAVLVLLVVVYLVSRVWHLGRNDATIHYVEKLREKKNNGKTHT